MTRTFCDICGKEGNVRTLIQMNPLHDRFMLDICEDCVQMKNEGNLRKFMRLTKEEVY